MQDKTTLTCHTQPQINNSIIFLFDRQHRIYNVCLNKADAHLMKYAVIEVKNITHLL